jgi:hypothetical protein
MARQPRYVEISPSRINRAGRMPFLSIRSKREPAMLARSDVAVLALENVQLGIHLRL